MPQISVKFEMHMLLHALVYDPKGIELIDVKINKETHQGELILEAEDFPDHEAGAELPEWTIFLGPKRVLAPVGMHDWKETNGQWDLDGSY